MPEEPKDSRGDARQSFFAKQQLINAAKSTFQLLASVLKNASLYPASHPFLHTSADKLVRQVNELLVDRKEVAFYLVGGELFFEKDSVPIDQSLAVLLEQFAGKDIGGIVFKPGILTTELIDFADLMNKANTAFAAPAGETAVMKTPSMPHIELHRVMIVDKQMGTVIKEGKKKATKVFMDAIETMKEMVEAEHLDKTVNARKINMTVQTMVDSIIENRDAFLGLTNIKMYDEYTFAHSVNTSLLASALGTFLSFEKPQVAALGMAGLLHDMGKVTVPHEIVNKPGALSDEEWAVLKRHPVEGALVLADVTGISKVAIVAAFEHHQHGDRGYPEVPERRQHLFSQIISLADAYDAITAARVYYSIQTPQDQAIRILIKKRGSAFNPVLVKAFVNMIGLFPMGTLLKLNTGEVGLVTHQTRDLMRPHVLLLTKFDGSEKTSGVEVSLLETVGGSYKRSVVGTIDPYAAHIDLKIYMD